MKILAFVVFVHFGVIVQCNEFSLLRDLNAIDFSQIFNNIFTTNLDDFEEVSSSRLTSDDMLREREYDRDKCVIELGTIADGLNRTEMWAMKCKIIFRAQFYGVKCIILHFSQFQCSD